MDPMNTTRRDLLKAGLGASSILTFGGTAPDFLLRAAAQEGGATGGRILVVVQLSGGNDGLNTVVPFGDDGYRRARPKLAIAADAVLKINDALGFHPALRGFADLLEEGKLAVVQGVGYAQPNRSHFESMDIWHSCCRKGKDARMDGWLGRYLDAHAGPAGGDVPALHLGPEQQPLALTARNTRVPSVRSLDRFRLQSADDAQVKRAIKELTAAGRADENALLQFVQSSTTSALSASERVEAANKGYKPAVEYPGTDLAGKLKVVAQLISAGLTTRIYYVTLDGFDTHSQQEPAHTNLLGELGGAVRAFLQDLEKHRLADRVLVMSFSEFGRRTAENASAGTDHGAAAPMFLAGASVKAGLVGRHPSLTDQDDGDLKFHTDFRQVYAAVLERWLVVKSEPALGGRYEPVDALKA
jgi:uncharacterized protein (DUF1501 family)